MSLKHTKPFLKKLEDVIVDTGYTLRYEKGNFQAGHCIINKSRIAVINSFFALEGKITSLIEIIRLIPIDKDKLSEPNKKLYLEVTKNQLHQ